MSDIPSNSAADSSAMVAAALAHLRQIPHFAQVLDAVTELPDFRPNHRVYFSLMESIVSQQLSVKAADTIFNRFLGLFPEQYPHPEYVLAADTEVLRGVGLSYQKAGYLRNVAEFSQQHDLEERDWASMSDEEIVTFLTQIKGVGKWTVQMILMFTLGRPDVLPVDDLGIQQGMIRLFGLENNPKTLKLNMVAHAEAWRPYRSIACRLLWRWKDQ
jgi:DNA-3-methyladenine glycosylase II